MADGGIRHVAAIIGHSDTEGVASKDTPRVAPGARGDILLTVASELTMSTLAIDTHKLLRALRSTGKSANFTAEEIAGAVDVAQQDADLLTRAVFDARMAGVDGTMASFAGRMAGFAARMDRLEARMTVFDAKIDAMRADIKAEVKASQVQNLLWLSGIMLASNGAVIAVLGRAVRLF